MIKRLSYWQAAFQPGQPLVVRIKKFDYLLHPAIDVP